MRSPMSVALFSCWVKYGTSWLVTIGSLTLQNSPITSFGYIFRLVVVLMQAWYTRRDTARADVIFNWRWFSTTSDSRNSIKLLSRSLVGVSMVVIMEATAETACSPLMRPLRIISRTTITAGLEPANTAVSNKTWLMVLYGLLLSQFLLKKSSSSLYSRLARARRSMFIFAGTCLLLGST